MMSVRGDHWVEVDCILCILCMMRDEELKSTTPFILGVVAAKKRLIFGKCPPLPMLLLLVCLSCS